MARQRSHSIAFKRQVAQEFIAGESLYALSKRHDISRQLIRVWVERYEAGALGRLTRWNRSWPPD
jgi:transposase